MTQASFDFQWARLPEAPFLLSDPMWRARVASYIIEELELSETQLANLTVLDAGCGNGRWSYGFKQLGCHVSGFDSSPAAVNYAREYIPGVDFAVLDLLDARALHSYYQEHKFQIIWVWGVIHHTPDPKQAIINLSALLEPRGVLHAYVYGKKSRKTHLFRALFQLLSFENRVRAAKLLGKWNKQSIHTNFDAFSPSIASEHSIEEVFSWFREVGLLPHQVFPRWALGNKRPNIRSADMFVSGRGQPC